MLLCYSSNILYVNIYTKEYVSKIDQNIFKMEDIIEEVVIYTTTHHSNFSDLLAS